MALRNYKTEIIIVGAGAAGMAAAVAAAEKGAKVILIEKNARVGGNGIFPMGIYAVDSPVQKRNLVYANTQDAFLQCMEYAHWKLDGKLVRTIINKTGDTIAWLEDMGVVFSGVMHHTPNQNPEVFHIVSLPLNTGRAVMNALTERCEKLGVEVLLETRGKKIIKDDGNLVTGISATREGKEIVINADKVIIATGGFGGNEDLIKKFFPKHKPENFLHMHGIRHKGDGIVMLMDAGAGIEENFVMEMGAPKIVGHYPVNLLLSKSFAVWVNKDGERFTNEGNVFNFTNSANACSRQPEGLCYVILDEKLKNKVLKVGRDPLERMTIPEDAEEKLEEGLRKASEHGIVKIADSIDEIAEFIGCERAVFKETIEDYNRFCFSGYDEVFAKDRASLIPLETPPYYAIKSGVDMIATHGGIRVNTAFEALNANRTPIKGLHAAGVDIGGVDADTYNMTMSGHSFGFAINSGRIAGECAASDISGRDRGHPLDSGESPQCHRFKAL